jgi:phosphoglycolate phosphatase-like HAD superfamily hydrolase
VDHKGANWAATWMHPNWGQYYSLSYLGMARDFVLAGDTAKARKAFQDFFELWKDADPDILPSWNDTASKKAIVSFVDRVSEDGTPDFVPPAERIATFDNDGTLWSEQPMYVQLAFILDRVKELAPQHPEWNTTQPYKGVLEGNMKAVAAAGEKGLVQLIASTHAGMTVDQFQKIVTDWLATAQNPKYKRPYTECVYQPMLELLAYLRANGFKTYIVSGGGVEFMRPWVEKVYGIPPEQVVGSTIKTKFEMVNGKPELLRLPEVNFIDDNVGKPVGINQFIGRRPIAAFGNSDGDLQMLQWTAGGDGPRLMLLVHHTDAAREAAYDRASSFGKLDKALDEARAKGWVVVDMEKDWNKIFPLN